MAASNYAACLATTLEFEGGWSNHPKDPGGATMRGIIQRVYDEYRDKKGRPRQSVRHISEDELQEIYRKNYWDVVRGDTLAPGVDLATFDFGVNSGPSRALSYLKKAIGGPDVETVKKLCAARLSFVRGLKTFATFGKGWTRRITTVEARGVKMALAATGLAPAEVSKKLQSEGKAASKKAAAQGTAAGGATTATTQAPIDPSVFSWIDLAIAGVVVVAIGFVAYRAYVNYQRSKAYKEAAAS